MKQIDDLAKKACKDFEDNELVTMVRSYADMVGRGIELPKFFKECKHLRKIFAPLNPEEMEVIVGLYDLMYKSHKDEFKKPYMKEARQEFCDLKFEIHKSIEWYRLKSYLVH